MQRIAFIIIAHSEPRQVGELVSFLTNVSQHIIVHVNADSAIEDFRNEVPEGCKWVEKRVAVRWGTSSLLDAILAATDYALKHTDADRFVLLSQSCLPIVSPETIQQFFDSQPDAEFIGLRPMKSYGVDQWRLSCNLHENSIPPQLRRGVIGKILRQLGIAYPALDWKRSLGKYKPAKGCLWWALTRDACEHILKVTSEKSELCNYANFLFGPEEIIPHTILYNSHFAQKINHHITYEDWTRRGPSPKWLDASDLTKLRDSRNEWIDAYGKGTAVFARKFQPELARSYLDGKLL